MGLKASACFGRAKHRSVGNGESVIWGEGFGVCPRTKPSPKVAQTLKKTGLRLNTGVAFAVLTSDVDQETMVSAEME